jgi:HEAT repeat protein
MLRALLADPTPGVQGSAALALARTADPDALPLLVSAYDTALAADASVPYLPEVRATLVRAAVLHSRTDLGVQALLTKAQADPDVSVRFIALVAAAR